MLFLDLSILTGERYHNEKAAREFVMAIAQVERSTLVNRINDSQFVAILCDGSTDISVQENEIIYVRTCIQGIIQGNYVHTAAVSRGAAQNILE